MLLAAIALSVAASSGIADSESKSEKVVSFYGYDDCIRLDNGTTRVTLCPAAGGRVLEYALEGKNALYLEKGGEGWVWEPGKRGGSMTAGRFDIGPELTIPQHPALWMGPWKGEITGDRSARLTSGKDEPTGVQLVRDFTLTADSSKLECKQTIRNISKKTVEYCHWSRTFAHGGGICVIPLTAPSRFPNSYVMYEEGHVINVRPEDANIRVRDGFLEITAAPRRPKLGFDTTAGWFGYLMKNDLLFVKQFPVYPDRVYNEAAGLTMSIWYPDRPMCELEPIGPRERLKPGGEASFTETWLLSPFEFPEKGERVDFKKVAAAADRLQRQSDSSEHRGR